MYRLAQIPIIQIVWVCNNVFSHITEDGGQIYDSLFVSIVDKAIPTQGIRLNEAQPN